ncbi:hypothetical protein [Helicobacter turcicus]|uniref:Uncharacterized protein n=1 Tax=Helicobacter turcicus TaxID=2867412 RepID=A0ABS7JPG2_9HELI|nr:hypothetical protein [Helicobacter turcicus]MBX7491278.1 hypothetical protein [Helicobacter turcicus]MBX7546083.1 hypothetical protein [Helicobacter turcicus]
MSEKELEIFELCHRLAELLGDSKAVANLQKLYDRHKEMFNDMQDVAKVIEKVVKDPQKIFDAKRDENYDVYKAIRELNDEKMGDVIIKNKNNQNETKRNA